MSQATRRCVECSQPIVDDGLLCPACQRRTGRANPAAARPQTPDAAPLYATALAQSPIKGAPPEQPPLYQAPPAAAMDLTGGGSEPHPVPVAASTYTPPPGTASVVPHANDTLRPGQTVDHSAPGASPVRPIAASDAALQKANVELAALTLKQSLGSSRDDTPWFVSFIHAVGARLVVRLVIAGIIGLAAVVSGFQHHHNAAASNDVDTSTEAAVNSAPATTRSAPGTPYVPSAQQNRYPVNQANNLNASGTSVAERQEIARANNAYDDALRTLNVASNGGNRGDMARLMAQVDTDVAVIRDSETRVSPAMTQRFNQAAIELENRVQALQAQSQTPMIPGPSAGENAGMGTTQQLPTPSAPAGSPGGLQAPTDGQSGASSGSADTPQTGDANGQGTGLPGRPSGGN